MPGVNASPSARAYALEDRAKALGFKSVVVIGGDLGISGTESRERPGFGRLLAAVCNGEVGAVLLIDGMRAGGQTTRTLVGPLSS